MWFAIGFAIAGLLGVYLFPLSLLLWVGIFAIGLGIFLFAVQHRCGNKAAAILCVGVGIGLMWYLVYDGYYLAPARTLDGETMSVSMKATNYGFETDYGSGVDGSLELNGKRYAVRLYINQKAQISPGDTVSGNYRFRYTAPGGREEATHHSGKGTLLLAYPSGEQKITYASEQSVRYLPAYLRQYLLCTVEAVFPEDAAPFVKALLLSDTSDLDYQTNTSMMLSGIRHIAAVSGLHVSILFSMVYLVTGKRRLATTLLGIPVLLMFAAIAGFSASVMRSCMMQILMLLAMACKREYDPPTALSFAVLTMLAVNPLTITSAGFQLSVGSVTGIFLFSGKINAWILSEKRLGRFRGRSRKAVLAQKFSACVSVSLSATVTTAPLCAWYFGCVSLVSVLTNLLCLWVVTLLFCGVIVACILGSVFSPLGSAAAWLLAWAVRYILAVSDAVAGFPLSAVYTQSVYVTAWLIFCYVLLAVFLLVKKKRPLVLFCCAVIGLFIAVLTSWIEPLMDHYRVTVLDVGQGQCVLLQSEGRTYMVDCGGQHDKTTADAAAARLHSQGVYRLDGLILTHYDSDHVGAVQYLLTRVAVDLLILPTDDGGEDWNRSFLSSFTGTCIRAEEDVEIRWGDAKISVFAATDVTSRNESSLCVLFQTEKCDILITGDRSMDGEAALLSAARIPRLDALIVGHHGAASATGQQLLEATRPATAVISVGKGNVYGHPSEQVLERLKQYGCTIRRTDLEGTVILRG